MPDYDFYHGLYSGQQVDSAVARALAGGQLDQDIAAIRAAVGSPLVANAAAEMTNVNKIYVYTGSEAGYSTGHWYYYEGGEWNDGGLYNSAAADDAMSDSSTNAVQNKVIKEYVDTAIYAEQTRAEGVESLKAPLASPAFTGTPTAPTAAAGTANTQIATTAYADNAVAVEKARAEAVEATKADQSFAEYILLREEEDRQILFGSIVEAAEDEYSELRSAPIHNAITIGGSVYPRMDRTRMAIDRILGRTVAFNQLVPNGDFASANNWGFNRCTGAVSGNKMTLTMAAGVTSSASLYQIEVPCASEHKYYVSVFVTSSKDTQMLISFGGSNLLAKEVVANTRTQLTTINRSSGLNSYLYLYPNNNGALSEGDTVVVEYFMVIDLTADYGTTLADAIYNMQIAESGAGVAYVRQRLDLDYYASNAGELKAPVVSGVGFVGFNVWNEQLEVGSIADSNGQDAQNNNYRRTTGYISVLPNESYYFNIPSKYAENGVYLYDAEQNYIKKATLPDWSGNILTIPSNCHYVRFRLSTTESAVPFANDICINLSNPSRNGEYQPYQHTSLSIPSTRLDGVGSAQDVMYVREDGENDYALIKTAKMGLVDLGTLNWEATQYAGVTMMRALLTSAEHTESKITAICSKYEVSNDIWSASTLRDKLIGTNYGGSYVYAYDSTYTDAATFKTAMSGQYLAYQLATPTETVIAEHLTLAEISAIAENGGIISIVNENGHIVQPDFVADVVISRSAS